MQTTNYVLKNRAFNVKEGSPLEFKCSACDAELMVAAVIPKKYKYCYNCGKKIILRSAYETIEENNKEMD